MMNPAPVWSSSRIILQYLLTHAKQHLLFDLNSCSECLLSEAFQSAFKLLLIMVSSPQNNSVGRKVMAPISSIPSCYVISLHTLPPRPFCPYTSPRASFSLPLFILSPRHTLNLRSLFFFFWRWIRKKAFHCVLLDVLSAAPAVVKIMAPLQSKGTR